jgi:hypothetical protein
MANDNTEEIKYAFLFDRKAITHFAKIDYSLKSGIHIQREYPKPSELHRFIDQYYTSLKDYYKDFFRLNLYKDGSEFNQYYYLDLEEGGKSNISSDFRDYLKTEYIIIGLLFFKMYKIDGNIELDNINEFTSLLFTEYDEEKVALTRLITDTNSTKTSDHNDQKLEDIIRKAFLKFGDLGWLMWDNESSKNRFKILPSFERLRQMYQPQIESIDELIKKVGDAE